MSMTTAVSAHRENIVFSEKGAWGFLHKQLETFILSPEEDKIKLGKKRIYSANEVPNTEPGWVTLSSGEKLTAFTVLTEHEGRRFSRMYCCRKVPVTGVVEGIRLDNPQAVHNMISSWEKAHEYNPGRKMTNEKNGEAKHEGIELGSKDEAMKLYLHNMPKSALHGGGLFKDRFEFGSNIERIKDKAVYMDFDQDGHIIPSSHAEPYTILAVRGEHKIICQVCERKLSSTFYVCQGNEGHRDLDLHGDYMHYVEHHGIVPNEDKIKLVKAVVNGS
jgi:hypothetical protein